MTAPLWPLIGVSLVWGYSVVGDSTQFSTLVMELADQSYVGTALTVQMALGFLLTGATIWLVPAVEQAVGWHWRSPCWRSGRSPASSRCAACSLHGPPENSVAAA